MTGNKSASAPSSAKADEPIGSDLAKVDAHIITGEEYEEIPEIEIDPDAMDLYHGNKLVRRGRPRSPAPKQHMTLRLAPDVIEDFRVKGPGWQIRMEGVLRAAMSVERDAAERRR